MVTKSTGLLLILASLWSGIAVASSGVPISADAARAHADIRSLLTFNSAEIQNSAHGAAEFAHLRALAMDQNGNVITAVNQSVRIRQVLVEGVWQELIKEERYLDMSSAPHRAMLTTYKKAGGAWENCQRQQTNFPGDGSKRPLQTYFSEWVAGTWQVTGVTTFAYSGNDMIGFYTDWDVDHDTFVEHQLWTEYKYDRYSNPIQVIEHGWNGEQWQELERFDNSFDDNWLLIAKVHSVALDESGSITPDYKIEMLYNKAYNWLMSEITSTPADADLSWRVRRQKNYTRGAYGQVSLVLDQVDDRGWRNERLTTFASDDQSRQSVRIVQLWLNSGWSDSLKETTSMDEFGRVASIVEEAATDGITSIHRWIYSYPANASGVAGETGQLPDHFGLSNYPNPFNPATKVSFNMPNAGEVTLRVFDLQGRLITELIHNAKMQAGTHGVTWNGCDFSDRPVASGIYLFELMSGNVRQVARGLLLK